MRLRFGYVLKLLFLTTTLVKGMKINNTCECGTANVETNRRIVGGVPVAPHRYPWLVSLMHGTRLHCGGAIITDLHVLSAGHCITFGVHYRELTADVGMHDRLSHNFLELKIVKGVMHPQFTSNAVRDINDIAVLTLSQHLHFGEYVRPICLPDSKMNFNGFPLTVAGWGKTSQRSPTSSRYLRETQVTLINSELCKKAEVYRNNLEESSMLCAYSTGKDACQGDSGGPLFATHRSTKNRKWYQVGIVSWGIDCAAPNYPGVYTTVSKYIKWIQSETADGVYCAK